VPDDAKSTLRRRVSACLKALEPADRLARSQRAVVRLLSSDEYRRAQTIGAYVSFGSEVLSGAFLDACLHDGKTLALPRIREQDCSMSFHAITSLAADLETNRMGFSEPKATQPVIAPGSLDLLIVPGVAFDERLNRLGRGKGFYDRFLAHLELHAAICALAYECQMVDNIPTLPHDRMVQAVFTEDRTLR